MDEGEKDVSKSEISPSKARENIEALTSISQDLPSLLQSAGSALALLSTNATIPADTTLAQRQAQFSTHVKEYYTAVNAMQNALLKQVDLLEEARILPREQHQQDNISSSVAATTTAAVGADGSGAAAGAEGGAGAGAGSIGNFDVAWLNARSRDVGREKERELVAEARAWLAQREQQRQSKAEQDVMMEE